jgi:hypothetical protein
MNRKQPKRRYQVGDHIRFRWDIQLIPGVVIEDRGNLGVGGRQVVRIRAKLSPETEPREFELAEDDIQLAPPS